MKRLDPTLDLVFRMLLTREPALLQHMLEGILGRPIESITIVDRDLPGEEIGNKEIILDIHVTFADGTSVDVEMQARVTPALGSRLVYYAARDYVSQLSRGDAYHLLTPTIVVAWLVDPLFPDIDRLHSVFELRERHSQRLFGDQLSIHVLQLTGLSDSDSTGYAARVERWARFFTHYDDDTILDQLAAEDPIMELAKQTLDAISQDPVVQRRARERADALKLYEIDLAMCRAQARAEGEAKGRAEGEAKGRAEGEAKGRAAMLLTLLDVRFGSPSEAIRVRVDAATSEQLDRWGERVLTSTSLDEVFAP